MLVLLEIYLEVIELIKKLDEAGRISAHIINTIGNSVGISLKIQESMKVPLIVLFNVSGGQVSGKRKEDEILQNE